MPLKYSIAQMLTFGLYKYRVKPTTELAAKADLLRQLAFHERKIRETAYYSVRPEVDSNVAMLMRSLNFVAQKGQLAGGKTAKAVAKIFAGSFDDGIRTACLAGLYKINNSTARKELLAIRENQRNDARWRETAAEYLRKVQIEREAVSKRSSVVAAESQ